MESLSVAARLQAHLEALTAEVVHTCAIEGEKLSPSQVRSSIARCLGMDIPCLPVPTRDVDGVVDMMLDATTNLNAPLTEERLFAWHGALFPTGRSGLYRIRVASWRDDRDGPMQIVSGPVGRERVHYEAPPAVRVPTEMGHFLDWFNTPRAAPDPVLRAALAHLWFVTIHPFDDGNGRVARAISALALAQSDDCPQRFYSMSAQIFKERGAYYDILETTQKGGMCDVTDWVLWFLECLGRTLDAAETVAASAQVKRTFWDALPPGDYSARQRDLMTRLLNGFPEKLTTSKWAAIAHISQDSAHRDILYLMGNGVLEKEAAGGRSTSYRLALPLNEP